MAQTQPPPPFTAFMDPFTAIVDQWFDAVEAVISAQREWLKASLDSPLPLYPIIPPMVPAGQNTDEKRPVTSA